LFVTPSAVSHQIKALEEQLVSRCEYPFLRGLRKGKARRGSNNSLAENGGTFSRMMVRPNGLEVAR